LNEAHVNRIKHGLVLTGVGDPGNLLKKSRRGNAEIDRAVIVCHSASGEIIDFSFGYDEFAHQDLICLWVVL